MLAPTDTTLPQLDLQAPVASGTYNTTLNAVTFSGTAEDPGSNLSRVKVYNATTAGDPYWDYGLSGSSHSFHIENVALVPGNNTMQVTAFDNANNASSMTTITINRETNVLGAVIIVAGHNEDYSLQSNIDNSANRAYRIFRGAGFTEDQIRYLASSSQDPDGDDMSEVFAPATTANIQAAIETWATTRVDANKPLYLYMMDHGLIENFCADGCAGPGTTGSQTLDDMLTALEGSHRRERSAGERGHRGVPLGQLHRLRAGAGHPRQPEQGRPGDHHLHRPRAQRLCLGVGAPTSRTPSLPASHPART